MIIGLSIPKSQKLQIKVTKEKDFFQTKQGLLIMDQNL